MPILAILFTRQGGRPTKVPGMQGDGFASETGGIMEVAVWLCGFANHYYLSLDVVWLMLCWF